MLTAISIIFFSIVLLPLILLLSIFAFGLSFIARIRRSRYLKPKPKGTIEVLPAEPEVDSSLEDKMDRIKSNVKDRKVGKDKFREL